MSIPLFLAMTEQDIRQAPELPKDIAWMACHFPVGDAVLSSVPRTLPLGSMLILDDRVPYSKQNSDMICAHMKDMVTRWQCRHVLLDLERPPTEPMLQLVKDLVQQLPCPVGVPKDYAQNLDCPVFLPPIPPHMLPRDYLSPFYGREIWLEVALDGSLASVTPEGCTFTPVPFPELHASVHHCPQLHSHYHIEAKPAQVDFHLFRTSSDIPSLLDDALASGVALAIGLFQELHD